MIVSTPHGSVVYIYDLFRGGVIASKNITDYITIILSHEIVCLLVTTFCIEYHQFFAVYGPSSELSQKWSIMMWITSGMYEILRSAGLF